jgi:hypothetical protein
MFVRGLDEEALAGIAGVSNATVSSTLKGKPIQMATLINLARRSYFVHWFRGWWRSPSTSLTQRSRLGLIGYR